MEDSLRVLKEISQAEFLRFLEKEDTASGHPDDFADLRRQEHKAYRGLNYFVATLTESGLRNLVLMWHTHPANFVRVERGGEPLWDVIERYRVAQGAGKADDCVRRVSRITGELLKLHTHQKSEGDEYSLGSITNCWWRAVRDDNFLRDHGRGNLYARNIHRFLAYGLWVKENRYQPIRVYYCEDPKIGEIIRR